MIVYAHLQAACTLSTALSSLSSIPCSSEHQECLSRHQQSYLILGSRPIFWSISSSLFRSSLSAVEVSHSLGTASADGMRQSPIELMMIHSLFQ